MTALADLPRVLTVEETAAFLRIGRSSAYEAIRAGEIPSVRIGRSLRVPRHALEAMLGIENAPDNDDSRPAKAAVGKASDDGAPASP